MDHPRPAHRHVTFDVPSGLRIAADAYGDPSAMPVLFLHGGGQTRHAWGGTAKAVAAAGFLAITMDHRGHGDSDWHPRGEYGVDGFVDDLRGVLAKLAQPPILVGASLGGITAMEAEANAPTSVCRGIVLVDVTHRLEIDGVKRILDFMAARPEGFASPQEAADVVAEYMPHRPRPKDVSGLRKNLRRGADGRYRWHWDPKLMQIWNPAKFDRDEGMRVVRDRLETARKLRVPTLLVRGRQSDVVSQSSAEELIASVPHAEYVDLAGAGHMVAGDRNDAFTGAVLDFVRRIAAKS
jgi:pimeloyl-ACP methyl ester carboxylesterase